MFLGTFFLALAGLLTKCRPKTRSKGGRLRRRKVWGKRCHHPRLTPQRNSTRNLSSPQQSTTATISGTTEREESAEVATSRQDRVSLDSNGNVITAASRESTSNGQSALKRTPSRDPPDKTDRDTITCLDLPDTWRSAIVEEAVLDMPRFCERVLVTETANDQ